MKFRGLQRLTPLAVQIRPAWAPAPQAWPLQVPTAGTPLAHLASHSLKGCGVTSQKLDSSVYSPNTETALWALLRHPDPVPPQGKRGFQPFPGLAIPGMLTSRDQPQGGTSSPALQQEGVRLDTKKNFLPLKDIPLRHRGTS